MSIMNNRQEQPSPQRTSFLHGFLSLIVPGLGQVIAGKIGRGISLLATIGVLAGLSIWTIAQRARFPDMGLSAEVFSILLIECMALLLFLISLRYLLNRFLIKDVSSQAFTQVGLGFFYIAAIFLVMESLLAAAGTAQELAQIYGTTAVLSAAFLAALWFWQIGDASRLGARQEVQSLTPVILIACGIIFILGWNITKIDLSKAISEYRDTQVILRRIIWPWETAFQFDVVTVEASAKVQAPCPEGAQGPPVNEPQRTEPWISVTPTCGQLSERDLRGNFTAGTLLTITGGNFVPGSEAEIFWKNPIGNPFRPRGVGETSILIDENGEFTTTLNIPEAIIPATAIGDQIHTLLVRQQSERVFTLKLSREMNLALVGMLETIMLGLMATFFGIVFSIPISFLAARNLMAPITTTLAALTGGLLGLAVGVGLASIATRQLILSLGGLQESPLVIASVGLVSVIGLGYLGWKAGSSGLQILSERSTEAVSRALNALLFAVIGAAGGYALGLFFSRGFRAIPLTPEVAALTEVRYAVGGAILVGLLSGIYALRQGSMGQIKIGLILYAVIRTIMNVVRAIEPLIWALVGIIWVGPGPFAGTIALTLHTIAALGKLYSEAIESIDPGPLEAIQATGGTRLQTIVYAVIPQVLPPFISFTIYRWDINVRLSTVIGLVGGGGIGFILIQWIRQFQYEAAGIAVWLIAITVAVLDYVSSEIRERFV
jgi:phosphonate ABC transporter permease subunit PhnE